MGIYTMRWGSDALTYLQNAALFLNSDRVCELLGYLYRRSDGVVLEPLACLAVGRAIDDRFNLENVFGVINRFFSSSGFGQEGGFPAFFSQLANRVKSWMSGLASNG
jgi:hypothetical protein